MMNILVGVNLAFGALAAIAGVIVLRGVFHTSLSSKSAVRFLLWSLIACIAGLMPLTRHLTPVQRICMISVYCSAAAIAAWLKFGLLGQHSRRIFAVAVTAVLYFDLASVFTRITGHPPLFTAPLAQPLPLFQCAQILFAAGFLVLGILAARKCRIVRREMPTLDRFGHPC